MIIYVADDIDVPLGYREFQKKGCLVRNCFITKEGGFTLYFISYQIYSNILQYIKILVFQTYTIN